jgi:hypothetical protein
MNKQKAYTAAIIALACTAAAGGWAMVNKLIDIKSEQLLSASGVIRINDPVVSMAETPNTEDNSAVSPGGSMTGDDMAAALRSLSEFPVRSEPHEPTAGQISMEEAIIISERALVFLGGKGFISEEQLEFDKTKTTAYLRRNIPDSKNGLLSDSVYSFWDVTFNGEDTRGYLTSAHITVNAVTGKIWNLYIPIEPNIPITLNADDIKNALARYVEYLEITDYNEINIAHNSSLSPPDITAYTQFAGGAGHAVIRIEYKPLPTEENKANLAGVSVSIYPQAPGKALE